MNRRHVPVIFVTLLVIMALLWVPFPGDGAVANPDASDRETALKTVRSGVEEVLQVLRDPAFKQNEEQARKKIRGISLEFFDYVEMAKRTLGINWNKLNLEQRKEFVQLFTDLLEETYIDRILAYSNEKVDFTGAVDLTDKTAEVRTRVITASAAVPINYRVIREEKGWKVYDVTIEGVSLVNNYRSQFREILSKEAPEGLLRTLRERVGTP